MDKNPEERLRRSRALESSPFESTFRLSGPKEMNLVLSLGSLKRDDRIY